MPELPLSRSLSEQFHLLLEPARWIPVSVIVAIMEGAASTLQLLYRQFGSDVEGGNNLILKETHDPTSTIPVRMKFNPNSLETLQHPKERACLYILAF